MSKIVFTGGATASGGYLVAKLKEEGHEVFTIGKGDRLNVDFRFMGTGVLQDAMARHPRHIPPGSVVEVTRSEAS